MLEDKSYAFSEHEAERQKGIRWLIFGIIFILILDYLVFSNAQSYYSLGTNQTIYDGFIWKGLLQ